MTLPLPTGWSTQEFNDFFASLNNHANGKFNRAIFNQTQVYLQPHVAAKYAGSAVPTLPVGWSTPEFNDYYSGLLANANLQWVQGFVERTPPYLMPNVLEAMNTVVPPSGSYLFDFTTAALPSGAALTRSSNAWTFNIGLVLTQFTANQARFAYDPAGSGLQGLLNEPSVTNALRNSTCTGAVAGNPGTLPTNWAGGTATSGISRNIVGTGTEDGIPYIDIQFSGTASGNGSISPQFEQNTFVAALQNDVWVGSFFARLVAGTTAGVNNFRHVMQERNSGGSAVGPGQNTNFTPTNAALKTQRISGAPFTLPTATTASLTNAFVFTFSSGAVINFTIRIGNPQLAKTPALTSPIITAGAAAVTRAADVLTLSGITAGFYDVWIDRLSGQTHVGRTDLSSGSYVVPTDPSPVQQVTMIPTS